MTLPLDWRDHLERLRREQNPGRYEERPVLRVPIPAPPIPPTEGPPNDKGSEEGVIVLDL